MATTPTGKCARPWVKLKDVERIQEKGHVSMFRTQGTGNSSATMRHDVTILLLCLKLRTVALSLKAVGLVIAFVLGAFTCGLLFGKQFVCKQGW